MRRGALSLAALVLAILATTASAATTQHCKTEKERDGGRAYDMMATGTTCSTARAVAKPAGPHSIWGKNPNYKLAGHPHYKSHGFTCHASGTFVAVGIANWYFTCWKGAPDGANSQEVTFQLTFPHGYKD